MTRNIALASVVTIVIAVALGAAGLTVARGQAAEPPVTTYFIADGTGKTGYHSGDRELAEWALRDWQRNASGELRLEAAPESRAFIRLYWAEPTGTQFGEMRPVEVDGKAGAEVFIRPDVDSLGDDIAIRAAGDGLLRESVVYLTCLHELGHALGLSHTSNYRDIMYFFGYGGDILEYFERYRRQLKSRADIAATSGLSDADIRRVHTVLATR